MTRRTILNVVLVVVLIGQVIRRSRGTPSCKLGWTNWNNACYKLFDGMKNANDARNACQVEGASLASIHSPEENEFIRSLAPNDEIFIGLNDVQTEGTFTWSDGSFVNYENWEDTQPDNDFGMEDCVIIVGADGKWNDTPCEMWYGYVCKLAMEVYAADPDSKQQSFFAYGNKALVHHVIKRQETSTILHCALLCINHPSCKTLNYKEKAVDQRGYCELNDATADDFPLHLVRCSDCVYSVPSGSQSDN